MKGDIMEIRTTRNDRVSSTTTAGSDSLCKGETYE
jgi:hypothetical protein